MAPLPRQAQAEITDPRVAREAARYGSPDLAIAALWNDEAGDVLNAALAERSAQQEAADPELKARRLRTQAADQRANYARLMDEYGHEIGRAQRIADPTISRLVESAARAALDEAGECLTRALAAEAEAERLESHGFVVLFDNVSARNVTFSTKAA